MSHRRRATISLLFILFIFAATPAKAEVLTESFDLPGQKISISNDEKSGEIRISPAGNSIKILVLTKPNRIAIDIHDPGTGRLDRSMLKSAALKNLKLASGRDLFIRNIRTGDYKDKVRLVFDLDDISKYKCDINKSDSETTINLNGFTAPAATAIPADNLQDTPAATAQATITATASPSPSAPSTLEAVLTAATTATSTQTATGTPASTNTASPSATIGEIPSPAATNTPTPIVIAESQATPLPPTPSAALTAKDSSDIKGIYFASDPKFQLQLQLDQKFPFTLTKINDQKYLLQIDGIKHIKDSLLLPMYAPKDFPVIESLIVDKDYKILIYLDKLDNLSLANQIDGIAGKKLTLKAYSRGENIIIEPVLG